MLYRLEAENFYSIRDLQILDLTIAPNVTDPGNRFAPLFQGSELRAPKVVAIYGPNAAGKTTLLRALEFLVSFVRASASATGPGFPLQRFNDEVSANRPIKLAIELAGEMNLSGDLERTDQELGLYRYELEIEVVDGVPTTVASEILRMKPQGKGKWKRVFERVGQAVIGSDAFSLSGYKHLMNTLRPNVSVLSSFAQFQHPPSVSFVNAANHVFANMVDGKPDDRRILDVFKTTPGLIDELNSVLSRIDVGIEMMRIEDSTLGSIAMFRHSGLQLEMPWDLESHGTRAFIKLFPYLLAPLGVGGISIVDELDTLLHPLLLPEILNWYYDPVRNAGDAQLWATCHSISLMEDLTKEELVLCEKDGQGRTQVYSLMDVQAVRRDENLYRKYVGGAYGAVPRFG